MLLKATSSHKMRDSVSFQFIFSELSFNSNVLVMQTNGFTYIMRPMMYIGSVVMLTIENTTRVNF